MVVTGVALDGAGAAGAARSVVGVALDAGQDGDRGAEGGRARVAEDLIGDAIGLALVWVVDGADLQPGLDPQGGADEPVAEGALEELVSG